MEIVFSRLDNNLGRFRLGGTNAAFANTFRRSMISGVRTLAIDDVRIYDNTSALFDEILAHRLGLIPIRSESGSYVPRENCSCGGEGCSACTATFTMSVEGPRVVYSRDLICQDPATGPAIENVPIVKLLKEQKLVVEARAVLSTGREHAKWQPTTACGYKNYPIITIDERCDACGLCVEECPRGVLETKGKGRMQVKEGKLEDCSFCRLCERACLGSGIGDQAAIRVTPDETRFLFVVEGDGSLPVREIVTRALEGVRDQSEEIKEKIGEISGGVADGTKE
ncbi:MAG: DNA-directed RNA polymerase subunit D [Methanoregulaceae archaeon]|nr:DNA-directed RNA polymerase subunit D [Methanoregulaceae archaeon]